MRALTLFSFLALTAAGCSPTEGDTADQEYATEWVAVTLSDEGDVYAINRDIRTLQSGYKSAWVRTDYNETIIAADSELSLQEFDCNARRRRSTRYIFFKGDDVVEDSSGVGDWRYILPESVGDDLLNFVCSGKLK